MTLPGTLEHFVLGPYQGQGLLTIQDVESKRKDLGVFCMWVERNRSPRSCLSNLIFLKDQSSSLLIGKIARFHHRIEGDWNFGFEASSGVAYKIRHRMKQNFK